MTLENQISELKDQIKINRKRIMKRAWYLFNTNKFDYPTFKDALLYVWYEVKSYRQEKINRLEQLEYNMNIININKYSVQPGPEFWMRKDMNK